MSLESAFEIGRLYKPMTELVTAVQAIGSTDPYVGLTLLPGLREFWPLSNVQAGGSFVVGAWANQLLVTSAPVYSYDTVACLEFDGTDDYIYSPDSSFYDITGTETYIATGLQGLTLGGWFKFDAASGSNETPMAKWDEPSYKSYRIIKDSSANLYAQVSANGSTNIGVTGPTATTGAWTLLILRYTPSTALDIFVNNIKTSQTSSIPASLYNGTAPFSIGCGFNTSTATYHFDGKAALCFLCAAALPDSLIDKVYQTTRSLFGV